MRSTFGQLLKYARSEKKQAIEDFSTEALAAALRSDFRPVLPLLRQHRLIDPLREPSSAEIYTQKPVPGGRVDLAMTFIGRGWSHELWLEVKVDASVHGDQMGTYMRAIEHRGAQLPTELAFLLKTPFRQHDEIERLYWREIRDLAGAAEDGAILWRDLALYLEEVGVTDPYDDPIRPNEAQAMLDASSLLRKMRRLLRRTARDARKMWPDLEFPNTKGVADREIETQFADHARLTIGTRGGRAFVCFGLAQRDIESGFDEPEPQLVVWVEHPPNLTDIRRRIIAAADAGSGLSAEWIRSWKGHWALRRHATFTQFADAGEMRAWWWERLEELDLAKITPLIAELGRPTRDELDARAEDHATDLAATLRDSGDLSD